MAPRAAESLVAYRQQRPPACGATTGGCERTSTVTSIPACGTGPEPERGLLDTSLAVDFGAVDARLLPAVPVISALTVAELVSGLAAAPTHEIRRRRDANLSRIEIRLESVPFDGFCACAFGPIYYAVSQIGRKPRGPRLVDLMIAATALAHGLPLYTLNAADLRGLDGLIEIVDLG